jgi:hypothetical protein
VLRLAQRYRANGKELETLVHPYGSRQLQRWVPVPPVPMRKALLREIHEAMGHIGRDKLAEATLA